MRTKAPTRPVISAFLVNYDADTWPCEVYRLSTNALPNFLRL